MTTLVFGHKAPDTDSLGSALIWAWYLSDTGHPAEARLLGKPNTESAYVAKRWGYDLPPILETLDKGQPCVIVDTNNPEELPNTLDQAEILAVIDHHKLTGGISTIRPIDFTIRPLACTATLMYQLMGDYTSKLPEGIKGLMLSCILSDTLEFRSPTTTDTDKQLAQDLAKDLGVDIGALATSMFDAKSDVSEFSEAELLRMDSKLFELGGTKFRISVLETTSPQMILARKQALLDAMPVVAREDEVDQVLLFVVDILKEQATLLLPNNHVRQISQNSFGLSSQDDTVVLPGIMSRKKQIIPSLAL